MRCAIYARYSTDKQREASIKDQFRNCERHAEREGWGVVLRYKDQAITGSTANRPGYRQMLADAEEGGWDVLLVDDLSRLSRDDIELKQTVRRLRFRGLRLVGVSDGFDSAAKGYKVHASVRGLINEIYIDDLRDKTRRGMEGKALRGLNAGGRRYGYRHVPIESRTHKDQYGRPEIEAVRLVVEPEEAKWVRRIFQWFADGYSTQWIAGELNRLGVPSPRGKAWAGSAIYGDNRRGWGLLNNEIYLGKRIWNRTEWVKDPDSGKRKCRERPETDWVVVDAPELRIVSDDLWQRVKARQRDQFAASKKLRMALHKNARTGAGPKYLLSGVLKCGVCGTSYAIHDSYRYACSGNANRGDTACGNRVRVARKVAEDRLLQAIRDDLFKREGVELFKREVRRLLSERQAGRNIEAQEARRKLAKVETEIANILTAIRQGIITPSTKAALQEAEAEKQRLEQSLNIRPDLADVEALLPRAVDRYRELVADLGNVPLRHVARARNQIKALVGGQIRLVPTPGGGLNAELQGDYRGLVSLVQKTPGIRRIEADKLSLVAGEGLEPPTRGL